MRDDDRSLRNGVGIAEYSPTFSTSNRPPVDKSNPKDLVGSTKVALSRLPVVGVIHGAHAMMDGADKYGPFNWRENSVVAHIYVDAAKRHIDTWFEGQECADDSGVHHLGHAIACCAILLDAQENGNLIDDRPIFGNPDKLANLLDRLSAKIKERKLKKTP